MRLIRRLSAITITIVIFGLVPACDWMPGKPTPEERWKRPAEIKDFNLLYSQNCSACHGADGRQGAAQPLNDPLYLALVTDETLRMTTAKGVHGSLMPAFAVSAGGMLTNAQIEVLVAGMRSRWARPDEFASVSLPPYSLQDAIAKGSGPGNSQRGAAVYQTYCAQCHGAEGKGGEKAGSIVDPNFLALVSDQSLRTTVITGRPDSNKPDWRSNLAGQPMTPQEISDVVAWLASLRRGMEAQTSSESRSARR
ncbi:MAG: c-type cytochrome [Acidobacteria bacterium]|nr:c-type cytochrome [Acidobacteriota bacterium]